MRDYCHERETLWSARVTRAGGRQDQRCNQTLEATTKPMSQSLVVVVVDGDDG